MANSKQSSARMSAKAAKIMSYAGKGGKKGAAAFLEAHRDELRLAFRSHDRMLLNADLPVVGPECENEFADLFINAVAPVLQPYFDDAESLAGSVISQAKSK